QQEKILALLIRILQNGDDKPGPWRQGDFLVKLHLHPIVVGWETHHWHDSNVTVCSSRSMEVVFACAPPPAAPTSRSFSTIVPPMSFQAPIDRIRYAQYWEDAEVLLPGLAIRP